jgi:hypothetical protein
LIIKNDTDIYLHNEQNDITRLLMAYRRNAIPDKQKWFSVLEECVDTPILTSDRRLRAAGAPVKTRTMVKSGVMGFYDRLTPQQKKTLGKQVGRTIHMAGRPTAFTKHYPDRWQRCIPFLQIVSQLYQKTCPEFFQAQRRFTDKIESDLRIPRTVFTTITVNQNWATHTHTDKGDFVDGMSCLVILGKHFQGGDLHFPRLGVTVQTRSGDVVFMDAHEPHGNTPLALESSGKRLSLVCYARTGLARFHKRIETENGETYFVE